MSRYLIILASKRDRERAFKWLDAAPPMTRIEFKATKRTLPQNDRMWAMLTDIASQLKWHGVKLTPDDWKLIFLDALKREVRTAPNLDGTGFVNLGRSSSDLGKDEMSDLIELIFEFGARHGVVFNEMPEPSGRGGAHSPTDAAPLIKADHNGEGAMPSPERVK